MVRGQKKAARRYLVIRQGDAAKSGPVVQVQSP
jgi:hypothetical protein